MFQLRRCTKPVLKLSSRLQQRTQMGAAHQDVSKQVVSIIGAPMVCGQTYVGTERAPEFLREHGLAESIEGCGFMMEDRGNLDFPKRSIYGPREHYKDVVGMANKQIAEEWCNVTSDPSKFVILLGGDQSIGIGSIAGSLKTNKDAVTVWVDAHANLRTPWTSETGNYHEMPVAFSMRLPGTDCKHFKWLEDYPVLKPENLIYIGLRSLHPTERAVFDSKKINSFSMRDVDERGIGQVMDEVKQLIGGRPIHLSLDVDACDAFYVSGSNCARGGLTFRESHYICEALGSTGNLSSMDICEVNPLLDDVETDTTYHAAISMIESCLGKKICL